MGRRITAPLLALLAALALALVTITVLPAAAGRSGAPGRATQLRTVRIGMGYVPSVQFAPFYVAAQRGYYRQAGLSVTFDYGASPNLLQLTASGKDDIAIADGTDVLAARAAGVPVMYVAAIYQHLPVAVFSLRKTGIRSLPDLRGKTVGIPGRYGSSYAALLAGLAQARVPVSAVSLRTIGYTQAASVVGGKVDAAVGYSNNEPIILRRQGYSVATIEVGTQTNLVGAGLVAGNRLIARNPAVVRAFVQATLRGLRATIRQPGAAFAASRRVRGLTSLRGSAARDQYAVLLRTIGFWHDAGTHRRGLGYADGRQWAHSATVLRAIGQLRRGAAGGAFTDRFVVGAPKL